MTDDRRRQQWREAQARRRAGLPPRGWVYVIACETLGVYKIGWTGDGNPSARLGGLVTGCPFPVEFFGAVPGSQDDEKRWHQRFAAKRTRGEWFNLDSDDLVEMLGTDKPTPIPRPEVPPVEPEVARRREQWRDAQARRRAGLPPRQPQPCGTIGAYRRHRRAGEEPCGPCRAAWNEYVRDHRAKQTD